jgi:hypothetical protein
VRALTKTLLVAPLLLAGLLLGGCATAAFKGRQSHEDQLAAVQHAPDRLAAARSVRFEVVSWTEPTDAHASTSTTQGAWDWATNQGWAETRSGQTVISRIIMIGATQYEYLRMPSVPLKPWTKVVLPKWDIRLGDFSPFGALGADPFHDLELLKTARQVAMVGREQVRGVPTTHYTAILDMVKELAQEIAAAKNAGMPDGETAKQEAEAMAVLARAGLGAVPIGVWLDDEGRVRRFHVHATLDLPIEPGQGKVTSDATVELFNFGVPVHVTPPPPSQISG